MSRGGLRVRDAVPDDMEALLGLWAGLGPRLGVEEGREVLAQLATNPDERLLVGELNGELVCCVTLDCRPMSPFHAEPVLHTSFLLVAPAHRKHGFAHALLEAAVAWAEERGIDTITALTTGDRESNRFLARLGLLDVATIRVSTVSALRHKLTPTTLRGTSARTRLMAQRRSARRQRAASGSVGVTD